MRGGQHELELHHTGVVLKLAVLYTVKFIGNISPSNINLVKNESSVNTTSGTKTKRCLAQEKDSPEKRYAM